MVIGKSHSLHEAATVIFDRLCWNSVYCLEFDSMRIITGSRDRTIKVWSLKSGRLLGTFQGAHKGSVLCLKFEGDWDREWGDSGWEGEVPVHENVLDEVGRIRGRKTHASKVNKGFMVSGSSDCSVCVWKLVTGRVIDTTGDSAGAAGKENHNMDDLGRDEYPEKEVNAEVCAVLKGHAGGVLDLKIDRRWIVSWYVSVFPALSFIRGLTAQRSSKDAVICVWDRATLELHRSLRGHEGPVNAVGLQNGKVVSLPTWSHTCPCPCIDHEYAGKREWGWENDFVGYREWRTPSNVRRT